LEQKGLRVDLSVDRQRGDFSEHGGVDGRRRKKCLAEVLPRPLAVVVIREDVNATGGDERACIDEEDDDASQISSHVWDRKGWFLEDRCESGDAISECGGRE
jgi:hypothetical protein